MSGHVGPAAAGPPPPQQTDPSYGLTPPEEGALGLDRRQERYWLIERRCKDLCLYLDVLSHAKTTASLRHVANVLWRQAPQHRCQVHVWINQHAPQYYPQVLP